jgi:1,4-dihydroxy-2-naphthoate polyprenyltransferase
MSDSIQQPRFIEMSLSNPALREILLDANFESEGRQWLALPREVIDVSSTDKRVVLALHAREDRPKRPKNFGFWLQTVRAPSLTASATPGLAVLFFGLALGWEANFALFSMAILGALFLQIAINIWNDVYDHLRLIDLPGTAGGSGILLEGTLSARQLNKLSWVCLIIGVALGLPVLVMQPALMTVIGGVAVLGVLGYSGPPLNLKYRALGDINVFLLCGPLLTAGFSIAAFSRVSSDILLIGAYFGLAAVGILHSNNLQDIPVDGKRGARTLASLLGFRQARHLLWIVYVLAWLSLLASSLHGAMPLLALLPTVLAIPLAFAHSRAALSASGPESGRLAGIRIKTAQLHLVMGLLLCAGLILSRALN